VDREMVETAINFFIALYKIRRSGKQRSREERFRLCRNYLEGNRERLSALALEWYRNRNADPGFPLVMLKDWLPGKPIDVSSKRLWLLWTDNVAQVRAPILKSFPIDAPYSTNVKRLFPKITLENRFAYQLVSVNVFRGQFRLQFSASRYFEFFDTCEALAYELCDSVLEKTGKLATQKSQGPVRLPVLHLKERAKVDELGLTGRSTVAGVNTLLIILNEKRRGDHIFYFHNRSGEGLAEAKNTFHVVPAGTFQPDAYEDVQHVRDFDLYRNVMRELAEELLGRKELTELVKDRSNFMEEGFIQPYVSLFNNGEAKLFFMGVGLDPLTTKPEILTCMVLSGSAVRRRKISLRFKDNFEGEHFVVPFCRDLLQKRLEDERTLSAGKGLLALALKHFDFLTNTFKR
jgi:hypothetical protein